ncbi:MAG TPA: 2-hydroxyacyl-CoA dehydratase [Dehalococcoidia bacterium]|nr:2-hydroxyacyl-CoA dehydratase [Dehalococcoidia bacterium]
MARQVSEMAFPVRVTQGAKRAYQIGKDWYAQTLKYGEEGKHVAWCMAGISPELLYLFDIAGAWPENFGATCAAYQVAINFIEQAEADGYASELCSYERNMLGYTIEYLRAGGVIPGSAPRGGLPKPTMLLTCGLICDPRIKGFQALARFWDVPMFSLDTPNPTYTTEINDPRVKKYYVEHWVNELKRLVEFLEKVTGKRYDEARLQQIMADSLETSRLIYEIAEMRKHVPSVFCSEDYFGYIHLQLFMLGQPQVLEHFRLLRDEVKERVEKNMAVVPDEKYRICTMGIPPWYCLGVFNYMESLGIAPAMDQVYYIGKPPSEVDLSNPLQAMAEKAWHKITQTLSYEGIEICPEPFTIPDNPGAWPVGQMKEWLDSYSLTGIVQFFTRSCRAVSFGQAHMRQEMSKLGVPVLVLEIDMADPRTWSDPVIKSQLNAFRDVMESAKRR